MFVQQFLLDADGLSVENDKQISVDPLMLQASIRVVRGPDWRSGDVDGGKGRVGTVLSIRQNKAFVQWDGVQDAKRHTIGPEGSYELRVLDYFSETPLKFKEEEKTADENMEFGKYKYGDQEDSAYLNFHLCTACRVCKALPMRGLRWKCQRCRDVLLCSHCYHKSKHSVDHEFWVSAGVNQPWISVEPRFQAKESLQKAVGFFPGAQLTVVDKKIDVGSFSEPIKSVVKQKTVKVAQAGVFSKNAVTVESSGRLIKIAENIGSLFHLISCCRLTPSEGFTYYADHLPVLKSTPLSAEEIAQSHLAIAALGHSANLISGDCVAVCVGSHVAEFLQNVNNLCMNWSVKAGACGVVRKIDRSGFEVLFADGEVYVHPAVVGKIDNCIKCRRNPIEILYGCGHAFRCLNCTDRESKCDCCLEKISEKKHISTGISLSAEDSASTQSQRNQDLYKRALAEGQVTVARARLIVVGKDGVGKSCFIDSLLQKPFQRRDSTLNVAISVAVKTSKFWKEVTASALEGDHYLDPFLLQSTARFLSSQKQEGQQRIVSEGTEADDLQSGKKKRAESIRRLSLTREGENEVRLDADSSEQLPATEILRTTTATLSKSKMELLNQLLQDEDIVSHSDAFVLNIWDHGGQEAYLMAHSALLGDYSSFKLGIYFIVYDQSKRLVDLATSSFRVEDTEISQNLFLIERNEDALLYWASTIDVAHPPLESDNSTDQEQMGSCAGVVPPPIAIVSTHEGEPKADEYREENDARLAAIFRGKKYQAHFLRPKDGSRSFRVDNTKSGMLGEDPAAEVRRVIEKVVRSYWATKPQPAKWLRCEKMCAKWRSFTGSGIADLKELKDLAQQVCGISTDEEISVALQYLNSLGVILLYPDVPSLADKVFVDPEWLVNVVCVFITADEPPSKLKLDWDNAKSEGTVSRFLAHYFLERAGVQKSDYDTVYNLLLHLNIMYREPSSDDLIVPALLHFNYDKPFSFVSSEEAETDNFAFTPVSLIFAPLLVDFFPQPLFFRLIVRFMTTFDQMPQLSRDRCLFHADLFDVELAFVNRRHVIVTLCNIDDSDDVEEELKDEASSLRISLCTQLQEAKQLGMKGFETEMCVQPDLASVGSVVPGKLVSLSHYNPSQEIEEPILVNKEGQRIRGIKKQIDCWYSSEEIEPSKSAYAESDVDGEVELPTDSKEIPSDESLVTEIFLKACTAVAPEKWKDVGSILDVSPKDLREIEQSSQSLKMRMRKVLDAWVKKYPEPTVLKLIEAFQFQNISRRVIEEKFLKLL